MTLTNFSKRLSKKERENFQYTHEFVRSLFEEAAIVILEEGKLSVPNFGVFELRDRPGRAVYDINNGGFMDVGPHKVVYFTPAESLSNKAKMVGKESPKETNKKKKGGG